MSATQQSPILAERHQKLVSEMKRLGIEVLALNPGPSLPYLTGLHFHLSERPVVVFFSPDSEPIIVLPELETLKLEGLPYEIQAFAYGENPTDWPQTFKAAIQAGGFQKGQIGIEPRALRVLELQLLEKAAPNANFIPGDACVAALRMRKDADEIAAMRKAVFVAQAALKSSFPYIKPGVNELEIASELTMHLLRRGSNPKLPFSPIVSGGPNSANPHASPTHRPLKFGDILVIDWGANIDGYYSDITRTFTLGEIDPELLKIGAIVKEANARGHDVAGPGIPASQVDLETRKVIEDAGYGEYFTHRTGHGLGLEGHEDPYIRSDNDQILEEGMAFTIEPGIYLPGRGGVRIEDDVIVTADGVESLSDLPRDLITLEA